MGFGDFLKKIDPWEAIKDIGKEAEKAVKGTVNTIGGVAEDLAKQILEAPETLIKGVAGGAKTFIDNAPQVFADFYSVGPEFSRDLAKQVEKSGKSVVDTVADLAKEGVLNYVTFAGMLPELGEQFVEGLKDTAKEVEELVIGGGAEEILKDFGKSVEESAKSTGGVVKDVVGDVVGQDIIDIVSDSFNITKEFAKTVIDSSIKTGETVLKTIEDLGGSAVEAVEGVPELGEQLIEGVKDTAKAVTKPVVEVLKPIVTTGSQITQDIANSMLKTGKSALETIMDFAESGKEEFINLVKGVPELGEQFIEGVKDVAKGTEDLLIHGGAEDILKDFGKSLEEGVRGTIETGGEVISDLLEPIEENVLKPIEKGISTGAETIEEKVLKPAEEFIKEGGIVGDIADSGFGEDLEEIGKEILNQITPGLVETEAEKEALKQAQDEQRRLEEQIAEQQRQEELQSTIAKDRAQLEQGLTEQRQDAGLGLGQVRAIGGTSMLGEDEEDEILKSLKRFGG